MNFIKKNYLVEKYKKELTDEDLKKFESGLDQASDFALTDMIDLEIKSKTITLLLSIFLGIFGADRYYLGDKKLWRIKVALCVILGVVSILPTIKIEISSIQMYTVVLVFVGIFNILMWLIILLLLVWWIVDIFLCYRRAKFLNRKILLSAAFAHPGPDTEKVINYHADIYKTMCFYDKFKLEIPNIDRERFKSAVYYVDDNAFADVESLKLKSRKTATLLSIFLGNWGAGSFYLRNYKRAISRLVVSLLLFAPVIFFYVYALSYSPDLLPIANVFSSIIGIAQLYRLGQEIDMCYYYSKVVNGKKVLKTLKEYRDRQIGLLNA